MEPIHVRTKQHARHWQPAEAPGALPPSASLRGWLLERGSLTARIRGGGDGFALELLREALEPADAEDLRLLDCNDDRLHVRRVRLSGRGVRLIFASTLVPPATLARHPWLAQLGERPLGEALADQTAVTRTPFEYTRIGERDPLFAAALEGTDIAPETLWARRSRFLVGDDAILVYEVFLPGLARVGTD